MSDRMEVFELIERLDAASRDETLADGMLYRAAAERLAELEAENQRLKNAANNSNLIRQLQDRIKELESAP